MMAGDPARELGYQKERYRARQKLIDQISDIIDDIKKNKAEESIKKLEEILKEWNY